MGEYTRMDLGRRSDQQIGEISSRVLNRLCKWRLVFTGWQLGTRPARDPESQAVRDQRELLLLLRAEVNTLARLLVDRGVFSARNFDEELILEAQLADEALAQRFPGMRSTDDGIDYYDLEAAAETMRGWLP